VAIVFRVPLFFHLSGIPTCLGLDGDRGEPNPMRARDRLEDRKSGETRETGRQGDGERALRRTVVVVANMIAPGTYCFLVAALLTLCFVVGFNRERRRLRNGVYLAAALLFLGLGALSTIASFSPMGAAILVLLVRYLFPLFILALAIFLVGNGVTMVRREGRRAVNLLSMAAGFGLLAFIVFYQVTQGIPALPLEITRAILMGAFAYISFAFCCFLLYSVVYGRARPRPQVDFVVVLGCGLLGARVPPLLASRLDRARAVLDAAGAEGRCPMVITSGGQGPDEVKPESHAMAEYLTGKGVPRGRIIAEDRSRNTTENLTFSREIMDRVRPDYRCVVVTNNFHALRAGLLARKTKVNGQVVGSPTAWYFWPSATIREFVAITVEYRMVNCCFCLLLVLLLVLRVVNP
jgi:uncharacterized SAM-binding protein YcdF (DUF218 family)